MRRLGWLLVVSACARPVPATSSAAEHPIPHWTRVSFGDTRVSIETPGALGPELDPSTGDAVLVDRLAHASFAVYVGKDLTLAVWRARGHVWAGDPVPTRRTLCNVPAEQVVSSAAPQVVEVFDPGNHHELIPATTTVTVGFTRAGVGVVAVWSVDADQRDGLRAWEDRFFASLRCR